MGTTPTYGFPFPEPDDEPDGPAQIEALADAVDTSLKGHADRTADVHGIADTGALETKSGAQAKADAARDEAIASFSDVADDLAAHEAATTDVHGVADTAALETKTGSQSKADAAEAAATTAAQNALEAHAGDTTDVHGIADTSALETQSGAQGKADAAQSAATSAASSALSAHANATTNVHGIADTSTLLTDADMDGYATDADVQAVASDLTEHEAKTTTVHGIADTSALETQTGAQAKADNARNEAIAASQGTADDLAAHVGATTDVHGIADTSALETTTGAQSKADAAETAATNAAQTALSAHAAETTDVHGIGDTADLETQTGAQDKADAAQEAAATALSAHAADTTGVHGITDTAALETQSGAQTKANAARDSANSTASSALSTHAADTTDVHGIADTSTLETKTGAQAKADAARDAAIADAVDKYLNKVLGGTVTGPLTLQQAAFNQRPAATSDVTHDLRLSTDTQPRFFQTGTGQFYWGPGNASVDTVLYRDQAQSLVTDGQFTVNGYFFGSSANLSGAIVAVDGGTTNLETVMQPANRYETRSRMRIGTSSSYPSGTLVMVPIWLPYGKTITSITFATGNTAGASLTHQWFMLLSSSGQALARTADATSAAWGVNVAKTLNIAQTKNSATGTSWTTDFEGLHYLGIVITGTTVPTILGEGSTNPINNDTPKFGAANTGMTTPPTISGTPWNADPINGIGYLYYGYVTTTN